jgi:hypothetical protein
MTRRNWITGLVAGLVAGRVAAQDVPSDAERAVQMAAARRKLRDALPYPVVTVPGREALATWERIRAEGKGWPVIVGDDEGLDDLCDQFSMDTPSVLTPGATDLAFPPIADVIAASRRIVWPGGLKAWDGHDANLQPASGPWPTGTIAPVGLTIASDLIGRPLPRVHIVTLPTTLSWEVPAWLRWGNWNACPPADYHCAALRDWQARFGAELVAIDRDTINIRVRRRPADRAEALALAREQFAYCPDTVDQGMDTVEALAALLLVSDWWYFWWD